MKSVCSFGKWVALTALMVLLISVVAFANGHKVQPPPREKPVTPPISQPATCGTGPSLLMAFASNVDSTAYIYTTGISGCMPVATTGSIQMCVTDTSEMASAGPDKASVTSTFMYPATGGSQYKVEFTSVDTSADFGGVGILKPMFGNTGACAGYNMPKTLAYAAAVGTVTITKDGTTIATNQPALATATEALHGSDQSWLSTADPAGREIHLIVPGAMVADGTAVPGFPNGGFYIYWPSAAIDLRSPGGVVGMAPGTTRTMPGGPARGPEGMTQPLGTIAISITNDSIQKAVGTAPFGPYVVQITNNSSRARGLVLTGADLAGNKFVRYSKMLSPGQSSSFQYFFAPGKVAIRDFLSAQRTATSYTSVNIGRLSSSIVFQ